MKAKILNVVSLLFGLLFANSGLNKFFNYIPVPEGLPEEIVKDNAALMEIAWLLPLIGFIEILAGILVIIPRTRALGALIVFPVMVGILLTHLTTAPEGLPMAVVLWGILIWILIENKKKLLPIIGE